MYKDPDEMREDKEKFKDFVVDHVTMEGWRVLDRATRAKVAGGFRERVNAHQAAQELQDQRDAERAPPTAAPQPDPFAEPPVPAPPPDPPDAPHPSERDDPF